MAKLLYPTRQTAGPRQHANPRYISACQYVKRTAKKSVENVIPVQERTAGAVQISLPDPWVHGRYSLTVAVCCQQQNLWERKNERWKIFGCKRKNENKRFWCCLVPVHPVLQFPFFQSSESVRHHSFCHHSYRSSQVQFIESNSHINSNFNVINDQQSRVN